VSRTNIREDDGGSSSSSSSIASCRFLFNIVGCLLQVCPNHETLSVSDSAFYANSKIGDDT
jgi:hypothetical protein